jgi:hypothetical protein
LHECLLCISPQAGKDSRAAHGAPRHAIIP